MTPTINTSFNSYPTSSSTTANKVNGRQQTVMTANFADMLNANMATSAKPTATASTDKVTLSTQVTQATAQDDIEVEAQKLAKQAMDDPMWQYGMVKMFFGDPENLTQNNQKLQKSLSKEFNDVKDQLIGKALSRTPAPQSLSDRYNELQDMLMALPAFGEKMELNEASLQHQTKIYKRYQEITSTAMSNSNIVPHLPPEQNTATNTAKNAINMEEEAQKLFTQTLNSSMWKQGLIPLSWGNGDLTSNNQQLMSNLRKEHDSMFGSPAMNTEKFKNTNLMIATLGAFGSQQEFTADSLKDKSQVYERYWELMKEKLGDKAVLPF